MNIRLIAVDVDGTLLNEKKELTSAVAEAIDAVKRQGILFTIATGRAISGIRRFRGLLSPEAPVITYNGAELRRADTEELVSAVNLPEETALTVIGEGLSRGFSVIVWSCGELYIGQAGPFSRGYSEMYGIREEELDAYELLAARGVTKVIWAGEKTQIAALEKELTASPIPGSGCCTSDVCYLEFMAAGVDKGSGLKAAAELLGLSSSQVMAVGDGHNDLPMLRWAGLSVAMGNASAEVKAEADRVTKSCEEDGLAIALRQLLIGAYDERL